MLNYINLKPFLMKKHVLMAIFFIITGIQLLAQKTNDVLYLKNGSIIYGKLMEIVKDTYKMQTADGSIFIYKAEEVEKFANEAPFFNGRKTDGFGFSLEAGFLIGSQQSEYVAPFSFNFLASITSNTQNITSVGSGVEFLGRPYTPLFLEYKYIIFNKKTAPFIFLRCGAVIPFGSSNEQTTTAQTNNNNFIKDYKGGVSLGLGTGISWAKENYETYLSFAYRYARTCYEQNEYNRGYVTYSNNFNRLEVKFGYKF
jgi:hypothetical protein